MKITGQWPHYCLSTFFINLVHREGDTKSGSPVTGFGNPCFGYILQGSGEFVADDIEIPLRPGDAVYIPKGKVYVSHWHDAVFYSLNFAFARETANRALFEFTARSVPELSADMDRLYAAYQQNDPLQTMGYFYSVLYQLATHFPAQKNRELGAIQPALDYLDEHYERSLAVPELARLCCMSESSFYAKFQAALHTTPAEYRNTLRVQQASSLLCETEQTVEQISELLGFSSAAYFRRVFQRITGESPKEFRRRGLTL